MHYNIHMSIIGSDETKINTYIDELLQGAGEFDHVSDEARFELRLQLALELDEVITEAIASSLPKQEADVFVQMTEEDKPDEELERYAREHIEDMDELIDRVLGLWARGFLLGEQEISDTPSEQGQIEQLRNSIQSMNK